MKVNLEEVGPLIKLALKEDIGSGDITTGATVPAGIKASGRIVAKERGIIAGLAVAELVFEMLESKVTPGASLPVRKRTQTGPTKGKNNIRFKAKVKDGARVRKGQIVAEISGPVRNLLMAERTALNFLQRLSGIATLTAEFVAEVRPCRAKIMDTRKTTPGWRALEKYAVRVGGGYNHRKGLYDGVLIKDNHIKVNKCSSAPVLKRKGEIAVIGEMVELARKKVSPGMKIEIEVNNLGELREALQAGADIIMLDNMNVGKMKKAVKIVHSPQSIVHGDRHPLLEASGGINLGNVKEVAKTGVDMISIGALTHSAQGLDINLEVSTLISADRTKNKNKNKKNKK